MGRGGIQSRSDVGLAHFWPLVQLPATQGAACVFHHHQPVGQYLLRLRIPAHDQQQVPRTRV